MWFMLPFFSTESNVCSPSKYDHLLQETVEDILIQHSSGISGFFLHVPLFLFFSKGNEQLWVQITTFISGSPHLHSLHKAAFLFWPHTCGKLNRDSLHEHRELWQSCSKQRLSKSLPKKVWLMLICCQLPPHNKGAEWWCRPEKTHHGDGDWDARCLDGNI